MSEFPAEAIAIEQEREEKEEELSNWIIKSGVCNLKKGFFYELLNDKKMGVD